MKAMIISLALFLTTFSFVCCTGCVERAGTISFPKIDGNAVLKHTKILSSDEFEGRGPGTNGEDKTVNYIVEEFKKVGLEPGNTDTPHHRATFARLHT